MHIRVYASIENRTRNGISVWMARFMHGLLRASAHTQLLETLNTNKANSTVHNSTLQQMTNSKSRASF